MSNPKLALIPSGYKSGKVYSILPTDGVGDFDFTRQSIGTRVNKQGLIENAKSSGIITNELSYSEDFSNSYWNKQGGSSVTSNTIISPDGSQTADTLSGATGTDVSGSVLRLNTYWINNESTLSIYCKSLGSNNLTAYIRSGADGSVKSQSISLSSEWQRVDVTKNPATGQIFFGNTNGDVAIWGAMLSYGALSDYIKTEGSTETKTVETFTDVPRLDWLNSDCPSLLLEPQRTNLITYSEDFTQWIDTGITVTSNEISSPDGKLSADKLESTTANWRRAKFVTTIPTNPYTVSMFAKLDTSTTTVTAKIEVAIGGGSVASTFNLSTGSISGTLNEPFIIDVGNGWYRIGGTFTPNDATNIVYVYPSSGYSIAGTMFFWGAQVEQGRPTSYIKTEGGTVTRASDVCSVTTPADVTTITETFADNTTNVITSIPTTYTVSNGLIKKIIMN